MRNHILPIIGLLLAILIVVGYINPTWKGDIKNRKAAIAADDQALAAADEFQKKENSLAQKKNAIDSTALGQLNTFLPDTVDNVQMILDLDALAARTGMTLSNVDVSNDVPSSASGASQSAPADPVGSINLRLSASGTYAAFINFLDGVEHSRRLLDVKSLSVKGTDTGVYNYGMVITLYWLRQ